jgi:Tic22-like family
MKSLVRLSARVGVLGGAVWGALLASGLPGFALTPDQILQKLNFIPVFTIADGQGAPLVASPPKGEKGNPVTGVFISQKDAQAFLTNLQQKNPDLAKNVKVVPVSMAEVYKLEQDNQKKKTPLNFAYVPSKQQIDAAVAVLKAGGQTSGQFSGTPVFAAIAGKDKGFLTIQQAGKSVIPLFFNKEQLDPMLDQFRKQQPDLAKTVTVQVFPLEGILDAMEKKQDPQLEQLVLVPTTEAIDFMRSIADKQPKK